MAGDQRQLWFLGATYLVAVAAPRGKMGWTVEGVKGNGWFGRRRLDGISTRQFSGGSS